MFSHLYLCITKKKTLKKRTKTKQNKFTTKTETNLHIFETDGPAITIIRGWAERLAGYESIHTKILPAVNHLAKRHFKC